MTGHKQIEKSLKRPDSFQDHILKAIMFVKGNKQRVLLLASPVIAIVVIGYAVFSWTSHQAANRRGELAKIAALQSEEQTNVDKQREETQKKIDALRVTPTGADGKKAEISADNLAVITKLEMQIADIKPDTSKSTAEFKAFYDKNTGNPEGWMAGLSWAGRQLEDGKVTEARPVVEAISKASTSNNFYQIASRLMLIGILEDAGEFDAAIKECDILVSLSSDETKPMAMLAKGRIQYFKKSFPEARTVLNELITKFASSPEATTARSLVASMGPA
jgi:predicted negative regulator of RcsB-dependent stress response